MPRKFKKKIYIKDTSSHPVYMTVNKKFYFKTRVLPFALIFSGFFILTTQVALPMIYFKTQSQTLSKPMEGSVLGMASGFNEFEFNELSGSVRPESQTDEVNPDANTADNSIETNAAIKRADPNIPEYFYVTIPKLGIENAMIKTNSTDLSPDDSLGHYNGSSLPGDNGNTFIYGHSVLPWFYNPKNYKTIFSTLDDLETGDGFTIVFNNKRYNYVVISKDLRPPEEVDPLAEIRPKYLNESTTVLMTCWPAGTKSKRLMINAILEN